MKLQDFQFACIRFLCRFKGSFVYSPETFPNLLRGCFGNAMLKSQNEALHTLYEEMFKPEMADPFMERYNDVPKPFVLNPFLMKKKLYKAGDFFDLGINLFCHFSQCEEIITQAFCEMGRLGFAGGEAPFEVKEAEIMRCPEKILFNPGKKIMLDFYSPLQIREQGKYVKNPPFSSIFRRIYGRIKTIAYFYENEELEEDMADIFGLLPEIKTVSSQLRKTEYSFRTPKENSKQRFDGLKGKIIYEFPSENAAMLFMPWLSKGMYLHIGKSTSWGMGAYNIKAVN